MEKKFQKALAATLMILSVDLLVACQPKGGGPAPSASRDSKPQGTSDSGGGTGLEGKVFESYIVDPVKLPAYEKYVAPLLAHLLDKEGKSQSGQYSQIFRWRSWYLAPVELNKIDKESLGVSFMKNETQQIARQSMKSVWIDKRIYDQMSLEDQGNLLLHEFVMSVYFMRFMSVNDLCSLSLILEDSWTSKNDCSKMPEHLPKFFLPENIRALNDVDNDNIRYVTGWIKENAKSDVDQLKFLNVLAYKGFDKRFFNPNQKDLPEKDRNLTLSRQQFLEIFQSASLTKSLPDHCADINGEHKFNCRMTWEEKKLKFGATAGVPGFHLSFEFDGAKTLSTDSLLSDDIILGTYAAGDGSLFYLYTFASYAEKVAVGDRMLSGFMLLQKEEMMGGQTRWNISSVYLRNGIVTSIDKNRSQICQAEPVRSESVFDAGWVGYREPKVDFDNEKFLFSQMPIFVSCAPANVN
jgi:hypothetical protein